MNIDINILYETIQCAKADIKESFLYFLEAVVFFVICNLMFQLYNQVNSSSRRLYQSHYPHINRRVFLSLLVSYGFFLFMMTIGSRPAGSRDDLSLHLFQTLHLNSPQSIAYFIENILLFVPLGFALSGCFHKMKNVFLCIFTGLIVSATIEAIQYLTKRGYCQIDDVVTNTCGTFIGYLFFLAYNAIHKKLKRHH